MPLTPRSRQLARVCLLIGLVVAACASVVAQTAVPAGAQETVLHSFGGPDGAGPLSGVMADAAGDFYGTTVFGGPAGLGNVFKLTPNGSSYRERVLYNFRGGSDGDKPSGGLAADQKGALYGVTFGANNKCFGGCGTVFKLTLNESAYKKHTLYRFGPAPDANQPVGGPVLDKRGAVYGVTQFGGASNHGAVFKLTPGKSGYTESVIYSFPGGAGGYLPQAGLAIDNNGSLFGTTYYGGTGSCSGGCGTVFKLTLGKSAYTESVIYSFADDSDGVQPFAPLTIDESTGTVYGTTQYGGSHFLGTVFKLTPSGSGYSESLIHQIAGDAEGILPECQLLLQANGVLFGTTSDGGLRNKDEEAYGTVFQLTPSGADYTYKLLYTFRKPLRGTGPQGGLISDASGVLYGTTRSGGTKTKCYDGGVGGTLGCGVVFKLVP